LRICGYHFIIAGRGRAANLHIRRAIAGTGDDGMIENRCARCKKYGQEYILYWNIKKNKEEFICFKCWELIREGKLQ
jgi:hypothetical protein